jgi:two-component system phosphate regulon response regulator PhoB
MMRKMVFVIEDDKDISELITILLEEEQYEVKTHPNATSFWESLKEEKPDVILLDVKLPDGNGLDICSQVKAKAETSQIPIIMMSAHLNLSGSMKNCHADAFIAKPFDIDNLIEKVQRYA